MVTKVSHAYITHYPLSYKKFSCARRWQLCQIGGWSIRIFLNCWRTWCFSHWFLSFLYVGPPLMQVSTLLIYLGKWNISQRGSLGRVSNARPRSGTRILRRCWRCHMQWRSGKLWVSLIFTLSWWPEINTAWRHGALLHVERPYWYEHRQRRAHWQWRRHRGLCRSNIRGWVTCHLLSISWVMVSSLRGLWHSKLWPAIFQGFYKLRILRQSPQFSLSCWLFYCIRRCRYEDKKNSIV